MSMHNDNQQLSPLRCRYTRVFPKKKQLKSIVGSCLQFLYLKSPLNVLLMQCHLPSCTRHGPSIFDPLVPRAQYGHLECQQMLFSRLWRSNVWGNFPSLSSLPPVPLEYCSSTWLRGSCLQNWKQQRLITAIIKTGKTGKKLFLDRVSVGFSLSHCYHRVRSLLLVLLGYYAWISGYLEGRELFTCMPEGPTSCHSIQKGVPQWVVLSSLLFNLTLTHLKRVQPPGIKITLYADDVCISSAATSRCTTQQAPESYSEYIWIPCAQRSLPLAWEKRCHGIHPQADDSIYTLIRGIRLP